MSKLVACFNQLNQIRQRPSSLSTDFFAAPVRSLRLSPLLEALELQLPESQIRQAEKQLSVLQLDHIHPQLAGNKSYKLLYNLLAADQQGADHLLSFGGPYSNHLHALAAAGHIYGFNTTAMVRGYQNLPLTPTLKDCQSWGMTLQFVDKKTYQKRYQQDYLQQLASNEQALVIPEGGNNALGLKGAKLLADECAAYQSVWLATGSGCTFKGLAAGMSAQQHLVAVMALKGVQALEQELLASESAAKLSVLSDYHCGGFAKSNPPLKRLIEVAKQQNFALEPIYTGKLLMAYLTELAAGRLNLNQRHLLIHSGGLQGLRSE